MKVDEALMRRRTADEDMDFPELDLDDDEDRTASLAEPLQLVHYNVGEEYGPHHDFSIRKILERTVRTYDSRRCCCI